MGGSKNVTLYLLYYEVLIRIYYVSYRSNIISVKINALKFSQIIVAYINV